MNKLFVEQFQVVPLIMPVALGTGANTGDFVNMRDYGRLTILFLCGVGAASQDPTITVLQAATNGGSTKALNFTRIDVKQASALTAVGTFTTVSQSAANTYTSDTSGEMQKLWIIDIKAEDLDVDNSYDWVQVTIADVGTASQIGTVIAFLGEPRYAKATLPTAIA